MTRIASTALIADMWDAGGHMGGGWWVAMMLGMVLLWAAAVVLVVWLVRGLDTSRGAPRESERETAEEILDRRLAEGAISVDEYHERRQAIRSGPPRR
jgi:putative membrane protein